MSFKKTRFMLIRSFDRTKHCKCEFLPIITGKPVESLKVSMVSFKNARLDYLPRHMEHVGTSVVLPPLMFCPKTCWPVRSLRSLCEVQLGWMKCRGIFGSRVYTKATWGPYDCYKWSHGTPYINGRT